MLLYVTGLVCALGPAELCHVVRLLVEFVCSVLLLTFFEDTDAAASTGCMSLVVDNSYSCVLGCGQNFENLMPMCPWLWTNIGGYLLHATFKYMNFRSRH